MQFVIWKMKTKTLDGGNKMANNDGLKTPNSQPDQIIGQVVQKPNGQVIIQFDQTKKVNLSDGKVKLPDGKQILNENIL